MVARKDSASKVASKDLTRRVQERMEPRMVARIGRRRRHHCPRHPRTAHLTDISVDAANGAIRPRLARAKAKTKGMYGLAGGVVSGTDYGGQLWANSLTREGGWNVVEDYGKQKKMPRVMTLQEILMPMAQ